MIISEFVKCEMREAQGLHSRADDDRWGRSNSQGSSHAQTTWNPHDSRHHGITLARHVLGGACDSATCNRRNQNGSGCTIFRQKPESQQQKLWLDHVMSTLPSSPKSRSGDSGTASLSKSQQPESRMESFTRVSQRQWSASLECGGQLARVGDNDLG